MPKVGFPIRRSWDQRLFAPSPSLSQRTTSFIASYRQGIHQMPLGHLIALICNAHPCSTNLHAPERSALELPHIRSDKASQQKDQKSLNKPIPGQHLRTDRTPPHSQPPRLCVRTCGNALGMHRRLSPAPRLVPSTRCQENRFAAPRLRALASGNSCSSNMDVALCEMVEPVGIEPTT